MDLGDGPPVVVLDEVGAAQRQIAGVALGDHGVAGRHDVTIGQCQLSTLAGFGGERGEPGGPGQDVELADLVEGGGDHQGLSAGGDVGGPRGVQGGDGGVGGNRVQAAPVGVEAGGGGVAVADGEGGLPLGRVGESHDLDQAGRAVGGVDVPKDAAGAGGGALPVVPDEQDPAAPAGDVRDRGVQVAGGRQAGLVDDDQAGGADPVDPLGAVLGVALGDFINELVDGVGVNGGQRVAQFVGGRRLGGQSDDGAAAGLPGPGQHAHHGGLAGSGRGQRQSDAAAVGGDVADHLRLAGVQGAAGVVGRPLEHCQLDVTDGDGAGTDLAGGGDDPSFGVQHCRGGELLPAGDSELAAAVRAAQVRRDAVVGGHVGVGADGDAVVRGHGPVGDEPCLFKYLGRVDARGPDLSDGLGVQVRLAPSGPGGRHGGHGLGGEFVDQLGGDRGGRDGGVHVAEHRHQPRLTTQNLHGLGAPGLTLLRQRPRLVFGLSGG